MAATIFPFTFLRRGFVEYLSFRNAVHEQSAGRRTLQKLHAAGELVVRGSLLFPNKGRLVAGLRGVLERALRWASRRSSTSRSTPARRR